jgi:hypothetical protein
MERHIAKRLGIPCAVISAPVHVQDFPARYSPQMGFEGANVLFDTWVHPLMMGLEEHLLTMFRDDFEFHDEAGPSHLGRPWGWRPAPAEAVAGRGRSRDARSPARGRAVPLAGRCRARAEEDPVLCPRQGAPQHRNASPPSAASPRSRSRHCTKPRPIMRDDRISLTRRPVRVVDRHAGQPCGRPRRARCRACGAISPGCSRHHPCRRRMGRKTPAALMPMRRRGEPRRHVMANLLFMEEHITAILPELPPRRDPCDALVG